MNTKPFAYMISDVPRLGSANFSTVLAHDAEEAARLHADRFDLGGVKEQPLSEDGDQFLVIGPCYGSLPYAAQPQEGSRIPARAFAFNQ